MLAKIKAGRSVATWALYDVANTVFNLGVVGLFIPLWITQREGTTDADLGLPIAASMVIVLITSPFLGVLTDQSKFRNLVFTILNLVAVTCTFLIGVKDNYELGLFFFSISFICVYLAELIYNSMLAEASTSKNRGKIGGIGIAIGYLGSIIVILLILQFEEISHNYGLAFQVFAGIFLMAALPISIFFVPNRELDLGIRSTSRSFWTQIKATQNHFRLNPKLLRFFIARYFYMTAILTASTFAVLYGIKTIGFTARQVELVLLLGTIVAIPSAVMWGYIVDKIGPTTALRFNLIGWIFILIGTVSIPWMNLNTQLWWPLSVITGLCYGGLWAADRPLLIKLSRSNLGEMFGIYGAIGRSAFLTGSVVWPFIAVTMDLGQPSSVVFLLICVIIASFILTGIHDDRIGQA